LRQIKKNKNDYFYFEFNNDSKSFICKTNSESNNSSLNCYVDLKDNSQESKIEIYDKFHIMFYEKKSNNFPQYFLFNFEDEDNSDLIITMIEDEKINSNSKYCKYCRKYFPENQVNLSKCCNMVMICNNCKPNKKTCYGCFEPL